MITFMSVGVPVDNYKVPTFKKMFADNNIDYEVIPTPNGLDSVTTFRCIVATVAMENFIALVARTNDEAKALKNKEN